MVEQSLLDVIRELFVYDLVALHTDSNQQGVQEYAVCFLGFIGPIKHTACCTLQMASFVQIFVSDLNPGFKIIT